MHRKKCYQVGLVLVGLAAGIILSILIPDAFIILVLAIAVLLAGILILR